MNDKKIKHLYTNNLAVDFVLDVFEEYSLPFGHQVDFHGVVSLQLLVAHLQHRRVSLAFLHQLLQRVRLSQRRSRQLFERKIEIGLWSLFTKRVNLLKTFISLLCTTSKVYLKIYKVKTLELIVHNK